MKTISTNFVIVIALSALFLGILVERYTNIIPLYNIPSNPPIEKTYEQLTEWQLLELATMKTESDFNPLAMGKKGDKGILQLTPPFIDDVNRIVGDKDRYVYEDAFDPKVSLEMYNIYQNHYNKNKDVMKAIHLHNPRGESIGYTKRVLKNMEYIRQYERMRALVVQ